MSKRARIIAGAAVVVVAVVVAAIVWWNLRDDGPEAVGLGAAVVQLESVARDDTGDSSSTEPGGGESVAPAVEPAGDAGPAPSAPTGDVPSTGVGGGPETATVDAEPGGGAAQTLEPTGDVPSAGVTSDPEAAPLGAEASGLAGVWTLVRADGEDASVGDRPVSFAGYRVTEVLVGGIGENTVVGRTTEVDGHIELAGTALVGATVKVEMATLRTDDSHRDSHMRQALNTKEFPLATFELVEPVELPPGVSRVSRSRGWPWAISRSEGSPTARCSICKLNLLATSSWSWGPARWFSATTA